MTAPSGGRGDARAEPCSLPSFAERQLLSLKNRPLNRSDLLLYVE